MPIDWTHQMVHFLIVFSKNGAEATVSYKIDRLTISPNDTIKTNDIIQFENEVPYRCNKKFL